MARAASETQKPARSRVSLVPIGVFPEVPVRAATGFDRRRASSTVARTSGSKSPIDPLCGRRQAEDNAKRESLTSSPFGILESGIENAQVRFSLMVRLIEKASVAPFRLPLAEKVPAAPANVPAPPFTGPFTEKVKFAAPVSRPEPE